MKEQSARALFGREHDLDTVTTMLRSAECRLVTLAGSGGIGKTSLAQQIVRQLKPDFDDHAYIISLESITEPQQIAAAVLEQLGLRSHGSSDPAEQLIRFLKSNQLLLVLDNFEHLLEGTTVITNILEQTNQTKLLITSREVLNLQQEWVWPVRGIAYPDEAQTGAMDYAAIRMFEAQARRIKPDFSLQQELPAVVQICALVEGSPLALELASAWLKSLTCHDILEELRRDIDILSTQMRDMPAQHRSIRAVFDHSWSLLTTDEQRVLTRLSLFRGSFTREAASAVARASLRMLTALIDKSLLYHQPDGRYRFHELFRQYAHGHLDKEAAAQASTTLTTYYRDFLAARLADLWGLRQNDAIREVAAELHNLRGLSGQLIFTDDAAASRRAVYVLSEIYQFMGYYREGADFTGQVINQLEAKGQDDLNSEQVYMLAEMLNNLSWLYIRLGEFEPAEKAIEQAAAIYDAYRLVPTIGMASDPRISMGELRNIQGDTDAAQALSEAAYTGAIVRGDLLNGSVALYIQANVALAKEEYTLAQNHIEEAVRLTQQAGNLWFLAYCLNQQGHICRERGDYASAQRHYEESYGIRESFDDPEGQAVALNHLGTLALLQQQYEQAAELLEKSLPIYQRLEDRGGLFTAHEGLGLACAALGEFDTARDHLVQAAQIASDVQVTSWWLSLCEAAGEFFAMTGDVERGASLIYLAHQHPESKSTSRIRADRWLQRSTHMPAAPADLKMVTQQLEHQLVTHVWQQPTPTSTKIHSDLVEPLTERELEILRLIADGMTNQEIADHLVLVMGTIKSHNYNIFGKLGVKNRSQAIKRARELNLL